jgi:hypothetical protein
MTLDEIKSRAGMAGCSSMIEYEETDQEIRLIIPRDSVLASRIKRDVIGYKHDPIPWGSQAAFIIKK